MKSRVAVVCASPLLAIFAFNCSVPDFCEGAACNDVDSGDGAAQDSSADGPVADGSKLSDGAMGDGASTCDLTADPKDSPACVVSADGIFVDSAGSDSNAGTLAAPVKSIMKGIALAQGGKARVYVCAGSYSEPVVITSTVSIYGGFACGTYAYTGTLPVVTAPVGSSALTVSGASAVTIEDMQWVSLDASGNDAAGNGNSSVAAFISGAAGISVKRSTFVAGAGASALPGSTTAASYAEPAQIGNPGTAAAGGAAFSVTCTNGSGKTTTGKGGEPISGGNGGGMGASDPAISPAYPTGDDGAPGGTNCGNAAAHEGSFGAGGGGGAAVPAVGALTPSSWIPSSGGDGTFGGAGEGGGGGGSTDGSGGGGSGSAGGCGGDGGKGGAGGGASIGIALYQSALTISASTVRVGVGGAGGSGSKGGEGQDTSGGGGGFGKGCQGAVGGYGGSGGGGAGGTGGSSLGIVWTGSAPKIDGTVINSAALVGGIAVPTGSVTGGGAGSGGDAVGAMALSGAAGAIGTPGVTQAVLGL